MSEPPAIDWKARQAEQLAEHRRRQTERAAVRAEFAAARKAGLRARHSAKLARTHDTPTQDTP